MRLTKRDKITGAARNAAGSTEAQLLERLCEYEDAAEEVGLDGPYAVAAILRVAREGIGKRVWKYLGAAGKDKKNDAEKKSKGPRCCGDCRHFNRQMYYRRGDCRVTLEEVRMRGESGQRMRHRRVSEGEQACKFFDPIDTQEVDDRLDRQKIIRLLREYFDLNREETADYLGVTPQTLMRWENLQTITNADEVLKRLCGLIGWSWPLFRVLVLGVPLWQAARDQREEQDKRPEEKEEDRAVV